MRGEILFKILDFFKNGIEEITYAYIDAFVNAPYGSALPRELRRIGCLMDEWENVRQRKQRSMQYYRNVVAQLKRDGLLVVKEDKGKKKFVLSAKGIQKLFTLRQRLTQHALPVRDYSKKASETLVVVTFDIPETERHKRHWLRGVLKQLSFQMLQQSVWIGKMQIPEELIDDLRELHLLERVEILGITKRGSLRQLF